MAVFAALGWIFGVAFLAMAGAATYDVATEPQTAEVPQIEQQQPVPDDPSPSR